MEKGEREQKTPAGLYSRATCTDLHCASDSLRAGKPDEHNYQSDYAGKVSKLSPLMTNLGINLEILVLFVPYHWRLPVGGTVLSFPFIFDLVQVVFFSFSCHCSCFSFSSSSF